MSSLYKDLAPTARQFAHHNVQPGPVGIIGDAAERRCETERTSNDLSKALATIPEPPCLRAAHHPPLSTRPVRQERGSRYGGRGLPTGSAEGEVLPSTPGPHRSARHWGVRVRPGVREGGCLGLGRRLRQEYPHDQGRQRSLRNRGGEPAEAPSLLVAPADTPTSISVIRPAICWTLLLTVGSGGTPDESRSRRKFLGLNRSAWRAQEDSNLQPSAS